MEIVIKCTIIQYYFTGILMLLGAIIYAADPVALSYKPIGDDKFNLHAGFALVIIAALIEGAGGIVMFIAPTAPTDT